MQKKLTITLDEQVYDGLRRVAGRHNISRYVERLLRPYVLSQDLEEGYRQMAQDEAQESEALEWAEATLWDLPDKER